MASTKKVASVRSLKKKPVPKKSVSSKGVKTPAIKKTAQKARLNTASTTKKTKAKLSVKKTTQNKKTNKKTKTVKIQNNTTPKKTFQQKLDDKSTKSLAKPAQKSLVKRRSIMSSIPKLPVSLALLSATRFPMNLDTFAMQTARIGGLMIVAMGAFFTLLYSQYIWNEPIVTSGISGVQMLGQVGGCDSAELSDFEYDSCAYNNGNDTGTSATSSGNNNNESTVFEPPMTFSIDSPEPLSGTVPIYIEVDSAETVNVLVFKKSYTDPIVLGPATRVSQGVWIYQWDTTNDEDEYYKVAADVTNAYVSDQPYRDSDGKYLEVLNNVTTELTSATSTTDEFIDESPAVVVTLNSANPVVGTADFEVSVLHADKVTLVAYHIASGSKNTLGDAVLSPGTLGTGNMWVYSWDTRDFTDGEYRITSKIRNEYGSYTNGSVSLTVGNGVPNLLDDGTLTDPENVSIIDTSDEREDEQEVEDLKIEPDILVEPLTEAPEVKLEVNDSGILSDMADLHIAIDEASFVEVWVIPDGSQTRKIIGLAKQVQSDSSRWTFRWNTKRTPNAHYRLFARVKNSFGVYESNIEHVSVYNEPYIPEQTEAQKKTIEDIAVAQKIESEIVQESARVTPDTTQLPVENNEVQTEDEEVATKQVTTDGLLSQFKEEIDDELHRLTTAYRSGDASAIRRAEKRLDRLKQEIISSALRDTKTDELSAQIEETMGVIIADHKALSEKAETLITKRVGEDVFKDSDSDGISDYDEQTRYKTDPFTADSDGDGFVDGVEIAEGYDPLDSKREVAIAYESPQEKGVVREDILQVHSVESVVPETPEEDTDGVDAQAVISGKALPNSFVTLYIFSTPIVVTVKTEEDGSWKYRFDKELEDGEHNVYVGLTDNAGKIVAKSEPFTFVKEAQAFSPVDASVVGTITTEQGDDSLLSTYMIYLILSISVVSIGLVLILLGLHLDSRQRRFKGVVNSTEES